MDSACTPSGPHVHYGGSSVRCRVSCRWQAPAWSLPGEIPQSTLFWNRCPQQGISCHEVDASPFPGAPGRWRRRSCPAGALSLLQHRADAQVRLEGNTTGGVEIAGGGADRDAGRGLMCRGSARPHAPSPASGPQDAGKGRDALAPCTTSRGVPPARRVESCPVCQRGEAASKVASVLPSAMSSSVLPCRR